MRKATTRRRAAATVVAVGLSVIPFTAPAQAADADRAEHCVIVIDKLRPGQSASRVLSRTCTTGTAPVLTKSAARSTLLMTWYADINYGGASTQIRGNAGPCDSQGYGFAYVGDAWNDRISSFRTFNGCNTQEGYDHRNYGDTIYYCGKCGDDGSFEPWVGAQANDRISSWWIRRM